MPNPDRIHYAIAYARNGFPVFPVNWITPAGSCSCEKHAQCGSPGKHPIAAGWQADATCDEKTIADWWARRPEANIGVITGKRSNLTVLDVDGAEGRYTLAELEAKHGPLPRTIRVTTGSGGEHIYFRHMPGVGNRVRFAPGLDTRNDGGFVVGVGSANANGTYQFVDGCSPKEIGHHQTPAAPVWSLGSANGNGNSANGSANRFTVGDKIPKGKRNHTLYRLVRSLKAKGLDESAIKAAVAAENNAKCDPPLDDRELDEVIESGLSGKDRPDFEANNTTPGASTDDERPARIITVRELLELEVKPREYVLDPILRSRETAMVYAWRGVGKTYFSLGAAYAIAAGDRIFSWTAPMPRRVVYIDGEMPIEVLKDRMAALIGGAATEPPSDDYLRIITADLQDGPLPNLASPGGQRFFEDLVADAEVVFIDSISTLCWGSKENDGDDWGPMQQWILRLRRQGKSVVLIHHEGKQGTQRGTSRREDVLDVSIRLAQPTDYSPEQGARFEVHFKKTRSAFGDAVKPFEALLAIRDGRAEWQVRDLQDVMLHRVAALVNDGATEREIADDLGIPKTTVHRYKERAKSIGLITMEGTR
jgi:hypothetical protein